LKITDLSGKMKVINFVQLFFNQNKTMKVAINGFGRIGRNAFRIAQNYPELEIVAINDLTDAHTLAHLLEFDSTYGIFDAKIKSTDNSIIVNEKEIKIFAERDPENLPWAELGIETVIESTGVFRTREGMEKHLNAGAKKVVLSAPAKSEIDATIVMGVNEEVYDYENHHLISNASCTTNCLAPVAKVINDEFGIKKGLMTTIHAYTGDQRILDFPHKDLRRARAAALSMIPTTTGAAKAVSLVIPALEGKLNGMAIRVPTPTVSAVDLVMEVDKNVTAEEVNAVLKSKANSELKGILGFEERPLVSIDFKANKNSSIIDGQSTMSMGNNMLKVLAWYDNEWGYSERLVDLCVFISRR